MQRQRLQGDLPVRPENRALAGVEVRLKRAACETVRIWKPLSLNLIIPRSVMLATVPKPNANSRAGSHSGSQGVQIRHQVIDLLGSQRLAIAGHFAPAVSNDFADPLVISRHAAL